MASGLRLASAVAFIVIFHAAGAPAQLLPAPVPPPPQPMLGPPVTSPPPPAAMPPPPMQPPLPPPAGSPGGSGGDLCAGLTPEQRQQIKLCRSADEPR